MKITAPLLAVLGFCTGMASAFDSVIVINEIHYNAPAGQTEWIELRNLNGVDVNTAGWTISSGIDFTLPATGTGSFIPGHGYLLIAATPALLAGSIGPFTGILDNGGETIRLRNLNGRIMDEVNYDDEGEWPIGADGSGATLSRREASAAEGAGAWAASSSLGGTPGEQNFFTTAVTRNSVASGTTWKYRDADAAPPADWNTPAYDDTAWSSGPAALGAQTATTSLTVTASLVQRFRASDITGVANGGVVTTWIDTANGAGYGDSVAQNVTGANAPTLRTNVVNGKAVVRFPNSGTGEMRASLAPGIAGTSGWAIFMVAKANTTPTNGLTTDGAGDYLLDRSGATNQLASIKAVGGKFGLQKRTDANTGLGGPASLTSISTSAFQIVAIRRNRTQNRFEIWVDGVMEGTAGDDGTALTPTAMLIAHHSTAGSAQGFKGDIAEVLIYKAELTEFDFQRVGAYLENQYGLNTAFASIGTTLSATAPTAYFRKTFAFPGDPSRTVLRLNHTVADGAVFYLNGSELARANMPGGSVTHTTAASNIVAAPVTSGFLPVPATALAGGTNVLAVSLHKGAGGTASYFDAALESVESPPDPNTAQQLRFNEIAGASDASFFIELVNTLSVPLDTSGWTLAASSGQTVALPAQMIPPGGFLSIDAAALGFTPADGTRLYLLAPGGTSLRDAREVTNRLRGLTSDGRWGHPATASPGAGNIVAVNTDIVINEIFYHAPGDGPEQWIELYNKGAAAVNLSGWKFTDGVSWDFLPGATIPAGGYLVVASDPVAFAALHPGVSAVGPWSGSLSNKGELITLRDVNDNVADQIHYYDGGRWSEWADGGGSSLELIDPDADNGRGEAWDASDESSRTAWQTVSYSGLATNPNATDPITWNEFVFGLLASGEFLIDDISVKNVTIGNVELIQNGAFSAGTADKWRIIGTQRGTVVDDPFPPGGKVLKVTASGPYEHMHNHAGTTLKNGASFHAINPSQTYAISFRAKWLRGSNRLHTRLYANRLARQTLLDRPVTGGTPGAVNSRAIANAGPTFDALGHTPVVPAATQPVTVSVRVADPDGLASVQLFTSLNGAAFTSTAMSTSGDGVFTGAVGGQSAGAQVQFYIRATDAPGAFSFFPAAGPASRAMIPWADGKAMLQLPSGARPHNVRIVLPAADATELYKLENVMGNGQVPCTVIFDEREVYYRAGVRMRASEHARFNAARVGFILGFGGDELFLGAHGAVTVDRSGGLAGGQGEILIKTTSNAAGGIHAPEDDIIRVIAPIGTAPPAAYNGSTLTGPAIFSKTRFDDTYLDNQWTNGGDGGVFKYERMYVLTQTINPVTRVIDPAIVPENPKIPQDSTAPPGVNVTSLGAPKENYRWYWLIENAREADDYSGLINVVTAVGQPGGSAAFNTQTEQYIDISTWLRANIPSALFGVVDNYLGTNGAQHNALIYFPPGQKAVLLPWDMDFLGQSNPQASLTDGGDVAKFIINGAHRRTYYAHLLDVLNRSFNTAFLTRWAQHYSRFGEDMTGSLSYLTARAQHALNVINGTGGQVAPIPFVAFARTSASPVTVSTPFATVTGTGWINIAEIRLQGSPEPLAVMWTSANAFTLQLPVSAGTNTYTLVAFDNRGTQLATTSVVVTGSGGVFPAGPGNLVVSELHYNPAGITDDTEFIELLNITGATLELGGCHFDDDGQGIAYTFPAGVQVPAGGRILVVRDRAAFIAMYPAAGPLAPGQFTGALDNGGESIVLYAASGLEILRTGYNDSPGSTDGGGFSLVRVLSSTSPDPAGTDWRASMATGGNPGSSDALVFSGSVTGDADSDDHSALIEYAAGTSDTVFTPADSILTAILNPDGSITLAWPSVPNADDAILTAEASDNLTVWTEVSGDTVPPGSMKNYFRLRATRR